MVFTLSLEELRQRRSTKWREYPADVLPLWIAEMDSVPAPEVAARLHELVARGDTGYPNPLDLPGTFADFAARIWGMSVDPGRVFVLPDVMRGVLEVLHAGTEPGAGVVLNSPVYPPFSHAVREAGRRVVDVPLAGGPGGGYQLDLAAVEKAFRAGSRVWLLCSPHNPVGRCWTREELAAAAKLADRYGVLVICDEVHGPLVHAPHTFTPFSTVDAESAERAVTLTSTSKAWNTPGLKCAVATTRSSTSAQLFSAMSSAAVKGVSLHGIAASEAAFAAEDGSAGSWLPRVREALAANRELLAELLDRHVPRARWSPRRAEATYLAWIDCRELGLDDPYRTFLERGRVALDPGPKNGPGGAGFVRLNYATSAEVLTEAVSRMGSAVGR